MNAPLSSRREWLLSGVGVVAAAAARSRSTRAAEPPPGLRWVLGSCLYGRMELATIAGEVRRTGADALDIWPAVHGNQREQVDAMGVERYLELLARHRLRTAILTRYDLGPFRLEEEIRFAARVGARLVVTGARGPTGLAGAPLEEAVRTFVRRMEPARALAAEHGITIGIENHARSLVESPESIRRFAEAVPGPGLGVALAPYHLEQDAVAIARLIEDLGPRLAHFYAWQHGMGCHRKLPKRDELLQMPGRGPLDFVPILGALARARYEGLTEVFMHPVPRGVPILATAAAVTDEVRRAERYIETCRRRALASLR